MSLRDQLLKKGLVDKKRARKLDREAKRERRKKQGHRQKRSAEEQAAAERAAAEERARIEARRQARVAERAAREAVEREARLRQIALANRIRARGPVPFHHKALDGRRIHRLDVHPRVAWKLRAGEAAIVALRHGDGEPEYAVVNAGAARRLVDLDPTVVVFFVHDTAGISDPSEQFSEPMEVGSLRPRRVRTAADQGPGAPVGTPRV